MVAARALLSVTNTDPNVAQNSFHHFQTKDIILCPTATRSRLLDGVSTSSSGSARVTFDIGPSVRKGTVGREFPAWIMYRPAPLFVGSFGLNGELFRLGGFGSPGMWTRRGWLGGDILSLRGRSNIPVLLRLRGAVGDAFQRRHRAAFPHLFRRSYVHAVLRGPTRRVCKRPFPGLVRAEARAQRTVEAPMDHGFRHQWPLDQGRWRHAGESGPSGCGVSKSIDCVLRRCVKSGTGIPRLAGIALPVEGPPTLAFALGPQADATLNRLFTHL